MPNATGLHILHDSGAPNQSGANYTTLVFVHGYGYHSGTFARLVPYAGEHDTRLILVNRRDYPGAKPYLDEDRGLLSPVPGDPDALKSSISRFMKDRALEFTAFLIELTREGAIPPTEPRINTGGLVLIGWSMGGLWMTAFLAHISSSPHSRALRQYIRRVVVYDPPSFVLGYPRPENIFDAFTLALQGDWQYTLDWFSGYFAHGSTVHSLECRTPLPHPPPTLSTLSPAEKARQSTRTPISRGGSDQILASDGYRCGLLREIWKKALYLNQSSPVELGRASDAGAADEWEDVEVRHVWCDMSFWETPHAALMIQAELADARARGRRVRDVVSVRLRGVNHFAHWAHPERTLRAFLADEARAMETSTPAARL